MAEKARTRSWILEEQHLVESRAELKAMVETGAASGWEAAMALLFALMRLPTSPRDAVRAVSAR
jgi:hypothetical protein